MQSWTDTANYDGRVINWLREKKSAKISQWEERDKRGEIKSKSQNKSKESDEEDGF